MSQVCASGDSRLHGHNDVTARDAMTGGPWARGNRFGTLHPLGPWITVSPPSTSEYGDPFLPEWEEGRQCGSTARDAGTPSSWFPTCHQMTPLPGDASS